jgi:hypothetical protein
LAKGAAGGIVCETATCTELACVFRTAVPRNTRVPITFPIIPRIISRFNFRAAPARAIFSIIPRISRVPAIFRIIFPTFLPIVSRVIFRAAPTRAIFPIVFRMSRVRVDLPAIFCLDSRAAPT